MAETNEPTGPDFDAALVMVTVGDDTASHDVEAVGPDRLGGVKVTTVADHGLAVGSHPVVITGTSSPA